MISRAFGPGIWVFMSMVGTFGPPRGRRTRRLHGLASCGISANRRSGARDGRRSFGVATCFRPLAARALPHFDVVRTVLVVVTVEEHVRRTADVRDGAVLTHPARVLAGTRSRFDERVRRIGAAIVSRLVPDEDLPRLLETLGLVAAHVPTRLRRDRVALRQRDADTTRPEQDRDGSRA